MVFDNIPVTSVLPIGLNSLTLVKASTKKRPVGRGPLRNRFPNVVE